MKQRERPKSLYEARIELYKSLVQAEVAAKYTGDEEIAEEVSRLQSNLKVKIETMDGGDTE